MTRTSRRVRAVGLPAAAALSLLVAPAAAFAQASPPAPHRFEENVQAYEAGDRTRMPASGQILLAGDSQFFRWTTLHEDLPEYDIVNRGIDSFQTSDLVYFVDRLVLPYRPRMIVLHVGGNDVNNGKSAEQILADFKTFVAKVHAALPRVPIIFSSITPGPGRFDQAPARTRVNEVIEQYVATQPDLQFIDLWHAMLAPDGGPREDLWVADRIHPNHAGYLIRVKLMRPLLGAPDR